MKALALAVDVTDTASVAAGCSAARERLGFNSVLVDNAGIQTRLPADLHTLPIDDL